MCTTSSNKLGHLLGVEGERSDLERGFGLLSRVDTADANQGPGRARLSENRQMNMGKSYSSGPG